MNLKFLFPLIGLILGIYLSADIFPGFTLPVFSFGIAFILWLLISKLTVSPVKGLRFSKYHFLWVGMLFLGIGSLDYNLFSRPYFPDEINDKKLYVEGEIKEVATLASGDRFILKINHLLDSVGNKIDVRNTKLLLSTDGYMGSMGDRISFYSKIKRISDKDKNKKYSEIYRHKGIILSSNVKSDDIKKTGSSSSLLLYFHKLREHLIIIIEKSSLMRPTSEFLISLLLGDKTFLSSDTRQTLSSVGMAHILALSGMHVAIILSIVMMLLFPLSLLGYHKTRKIISIVLVWCFVMLSGFSPSTVRAAIMATFVILAFLLERKNSALNALLAAVLIILLFNPYNLWDIGLQLSFVCVASILLFINKLNPVEQHIHPNLYRAVNAVLITIITTFATWVMVACYFKNLPLMFLGTNLVLLPSLPFFIGLGAFFIFLEALGYHSLFLSKLLDIFHDLFMEIASLFSVNHNSSLFLEVPPESVFIWLLGILLVGVALHSSLKKKKLVMNICGIGCFVLAVFVIYNQTELKSTSLKFSHSFTKIEAVYSYGDTNTRIEFPRRNIAESTYKDFHILSIDRAIHPDFLSTITSTDENLKHILFVGPEADLQQIAGLINTFDFAKIILHAGIGKNERGKLYKDLKDSQIDKIHSLGEKGSLEFDL